MSITTLFTGSAGAGMTANITSLGSRGLTLGTSDGWGEWQDTIRYQVMGVAA